MAWTCQRVTAGVRCKCLNDNRMWRCVRCGKKRPAKRKPEHMAALDRSYAEFIVINGGEHCGICGVGPTTRKLDRDHDHRTGKPRGLLCHMCNRTLGNRVTRQWLWQAVLYLDRAERPGASAPVGRT